MEYIKSSINILVDLKVKDQLESFFSNFDAQSILSKNSNQNYNNKIEEEFENGKIKISESKAENPNVSNKSCLNDYEELLRKHESEIRNHIKIQHQYRIYSENLKNKIEEIEKSKADYKKTITNLQEVIVYC
jgi:hypothetical protein